MRCEVGLRLALLAVACVAIQLEEPRWNDPLLSQLKEVSLQRVVQVSSPQLDPQPVNSMNCTMMEVWRFGLEGSHGFTEIPLGCSPLT
jgi:hypothetical protein